jgi:hypothetical protein
MVLTSSPAIVTKCHVLHRTQGVVAGGASAFEADVCLDTGGS